MLTLSEVWVIKEQGAKTEEEASEFIVYSVHSSSRCIVRGETHMRCLLSNCFTGAS